MGGIKGFWRHVENGSIYAIEHTPSGEVLGGVGPLDPDNLLDLNDYTYTEKINIWLIHSLAEKKLRRFNPKGTPVQSVGKETPWGLKFFSN